MGSGPSRSECVVQPTPELSNGCTTNTAPISNGHISHKDTKTVINQNGVVRNEPKQEDLEGYADVPKEFFINLESFDAKKSKIYSSSFVEADNLALNVPMDLRKSPDKLVEYLIKNFMHSELLKLRVIWRWITHNISYDVDSYFNSDNKSIYSEDTTDVLVSGRSVCSGYSNLLKLMGKLAGLQVECISGWSKGYAFVVGTKFEGTAMNHSWNAVFLEGTWWLFDCTWGAGYIDDNKSFIRKYNEYFFMTDPRQFIFNHFPKNPKWQLLEPSIAIEEYENMGLFTKSFFKLNMKPVTHKDYMIECKEGEVHLKFTIDKLKPVDCVGKVKNSEGIHAGDQYLHIYTTDMYTLQKVLHVNVTAPDKGEFTLNLYADKAESVLSSSNTTLPLICTYLIKCTGKLESIHTYPKQFKGWCHGFMLHSPMKGQLCIGETYTFKVSVTTDVNQMAVCLGDSASSLVYMENTSGKIWEGEVKIPGGTERITVVKVLNCENTTTTTTTTITTTTFSVLLEYTVFI